MASVKNLNDQALELRNFPFLPTDNKSSLRRLLKRSPDESENFLTQKSPAKQLVGRKNASIAIIMVI
jgi:hypothetical protein